MNGPRVVDGGLTFHRGPDRSVSSEENTVKSQRETFLLDRRRLPALGFSVCPYSGTDRGMKKQQSSALQVELRQTQRQSGAPRSPS